MVTTSGGAAAKNGWLTASEVGGKPDVLVAGCCTLVLVQRAGAWGNQLQLEQPVPALACSNQQPALVPCLQQPATGVTANVETDGGR